MQDEAEFEVPPPSPPHLLIDLESEVERSLKSVEQSPKSYKKIKIVPILD